MKILMLTPYLPFPLISGGHTRSYNLIKNLSKKHEITLYSLIKDEKERKNIKELKKFCKKVKVFKRPSKPWTLRNILRTGFSLYPFVVIRNLVIEEKEAIQKELQNEKYDLIHAETFYAMPHLPETDIPILLVDQTIEHLVYKHYVEKQAPRLLRPLMMIDVMKIRYWESYYWRQAKRVVAVSESDKRLMKKHVPDLEIDIVSNGVDMGHFSEKKVQKNTRPRVLYVGNFTWLQNIEAVDVLVEKVWPQVKQKIPNAMLWVVGMNMTDKIKNLASNDIQITEAIPDIRDAYRKASVLVAPIEGPGGTRLKILEAMASGLPVVTTPVGAEGLYLKDGKHAVIKKNTNDLAKMTIKILNNSGFAKKLGEEGKRYVYENYSWKSIAQKLDSIYQKIVHE